MEIWDVYDKNRNLTNKSMIRGSKYEANSYHLVAHVCIFNSKGEMLIQQRQSFKKGWSGMWDVSAGGSAVKGDVSYIAAQREVFEEIGLEIDLSDHRPSLSVYTETAYDDFYLIEKDIELCDLKLQYEEVQQVKWASKKEILTLIAQNEFVNYHQSFIELLFDIRKQRGVHKKG